MIHPSVRIDASARVNCPDLTIGAGSVINRNCILEGTRIVLGREAWLDEGARIGGGSCHDPCAFLVAGDWLHMGKGSEINLARGVTLGDEVGIGMETHLSTHGAWLSELDGYPCAFAPITIGSRVWLPHAWVLPGVTIGDDVVVSAGAVVNKDLPTGCLASGVPARVVAQHAYPQPMNDEARAEVLDRIVSEVVHAAQVDRCELLLIARPSGTEFDCARRVIRGPVSTESESLRNQLRRHGVRFRYSVVDGYYQPWE